jgi:3',5'-cyclic AMP phosphodiesterase CpdA
VALIGLTSACPQALHKAGGTLGSQQIALAASLLRDLRGKGYFCVVMIHHPPLPGLAKPRKALTDAKALSDMLAREGAGLVLHGHNHAQMHNVLESRFGPVHVFGVPSASAIPAGHHAPAGWCRYSISRMTGEWRVGITVRTWNETAHKLETTSEFALSLARA